MSEMNEDYLLPAEIVAQQEAFALQFMLAQQSKLTAQFGEDIASRFAKYWTANSRYLPPSSGTFREYSMQALDVLDHWIDQYVHAPMRAIATAEAARQREATYVAEKDEAQQKEDDVKALAAAWGVDKVESTSRAIKSGTYRSVPAKLRRVNWEWDSLFQKDMPQSTQIQDDACQEAWVKLLQSSTFNGKSANIAGRNAGNAQVKGVGYDAMKGVLKYVPISQMETDATGSESSPEDEQCDPTPHWDKPSDGTDGQTTPERERIRRLLADQQDEHRRQILRQFQDERPDDFAFIKSYVSRIGTDVRFRRGSIVPISKRGAGFTPAERKRAFQIISRLRRLEQYS
jgi:hypothetical protein